MQSRLFRTVRTSLQVFAFGALVVGVVGCSDSKASLLGPFTPNPVRNLAGVWSGTLSQEGSDPIAVTWTASQAGAEVAGPLVGSTDELGDIEAILAGLITDGEQMTLTLSVGAFSGAPACSAFGSGNSALNDTEISANIDFFYTVECIGVVTSEPSETFRLSLSRE
jgi:hypothetical protein